MADKILFFELLEAPDPGHAAFSATETNPREAMVSAFTRFRRYLGGLASGSGTVCLRFLYDPTATHPQARLHVLLGMRAPGRRLRDALTNLVTRGSLARFFNLQPVTAPTVPDEMTAACHVFRAHQKHSPLVSSEFSAEVPKEYFSCLPFAANEPNDWTALDRMLAGVRERVVIDVIIAPKEVKETRKGHARYLAQLQKASRTWNNHEDLQPTEDPLGEELRSRDEHIQLTALHRPDPVAQDVLQAQQAMHDLLLQPQFSFSAVVLAESMETAQLLGSTLAEAAFKEGSYELCTHADGASLGRIKDQLGGLKVLDPKSIQPLREQTEVADLPDFTPLLHMASVDELAGLFSLPIATSGSLCCMRKNTDPPPLPSGEECVMLGWDASGAQTTTKVVCGIPIAHLCRHVFATGTTGSGKTTNLLNLSIQLWQHQIPVLIFEPVKREFRALKTQGANTNAEIALLARDLEIFTPGNENLSPLRFNPLELPAGVDKFEQTDAVLTSFEAAFTMSGPLPPILREAIEEVYDAEKEPTVLSLLHAAERALQRKQYSGSTYADLRGALDTRLGSLTFGNLGRVFRCVRSLPSVDQLMTRPTVIEMDRLSREHACLLTLLILMRIRQAVRQPAKSERHPRLVVIIDEAHNLVGPDTKAEASEDHPNPKAYAAEFICRMLAEMRACGVAIIISDQTPSAVAAEVVKLPTTKLAFQQTDEADRTVMGAAMLFKKHEFEDIARLKPGEAYLFTSGYHGPRKIRTVNLHEHMNMRSLPDKELQKIICTQPWYIAATKARLEMDLQALAACMDTFDGQRVSFAERAVRLWAKYPPAAGLRDPSRRRVALAAIRTEAAQLKSRLQEADGHFRLHEYEPLLPSGKAIAVVGPALSHVHAQLMDRYEKVIQPDTRQCLETLARLIQKCVE